MEITALKHQIKNKNRVSVFVDGKYSFSLTLDQLIETKLKKGDQLEAPDIKKYKKLSDEGKQKQRALEWLMIRPHSTREFRDYVFRKKIEKDIGEAWANEFVEKKYLDDENFARWFFEQRQRKNKSSRAIYSELRSKGINTKIIQNLQEQSQHGDVELIRNVIKKVENRPRYKDERKLISYLLSKGFNYGDIKEALSKDA